MNTVTMASAVSRPVALARLAAPGGGGRLRSARAETRPNIVIAAQQNPTLPNPFLDIRMSPIACRTTSATI